MTLHISSVFTYDEDAGNYIQAVETADGQALESATRKAINNFVIGCKQDGIWDAIKASCILAGARTLNGALQPLVGTAPTNYNFVSSDYNRKTGLVGDGATKYLNSNRAAGSDPQNNHHAAAFPTGLNTQSSGGNNYPRLMECQTYGTGYTSILDIALSGGSYAGASRNFLVAGGLGPRVLSRLVGISRAASSEFQFRGNGTTITVSAVSESLPSPSTTWKLYIDANTSFQRANSRLAFYSIGESLDLAKLDGRVTDLINKFQEVIP